MPEHEKSRVSRGVRHFPACITARREATQYRRRAKSAHQPAADWSRHSRRCLRACQRRASKRSPKSSDIGRQHRYGRGRIVGRRRVEINAGGVGPRIAGGWHVGGAAIGGAEQSRWPGLECRRADCKRSERCIAFTVTQPVGCPQGVAGNRRGACAGGPIPHSTWQPGRCCGDRSPRR